ncbi:MAG: hypothetical protein OEZ34_15135 [Spirochaetia bacterium]|nr:hypothetical protein [Spirochaetia bacterium]
MQSFQQRKELKLFSAKHIILGFIVFLIFAFFANCGKPFPIKGQFVKGMYAGNTFEDEGVRELAVAAATGDTFTVYDLIQSGKAEVNYRGKDNITPLLWAFLARNKEGFIELLKNGADPDIISRDKFSVTGLTLVYTADPEYFKLALKYGADPNHFNNRIGLPILMQVCREKFNKNQLNWIVENGADLNIRGKDGITPVMFCADLRQFDKVVYLLEQGADSGLKDSKGKTLHERILNIEIDPNIHPRQYEYRKKTINFIKKTFDHAFEIFSPPAHGRTA